MRDNIATVFLRLAQQSFTDKTSVLLWSGVQYTVLAVLVLLPELRGDEDTRIRPQ